MFERVKMPVWFRRIAPSMESKQRYLKTLRLLDESERLEKEGNLEVIGRNSTFDTPDSSPDRHF